MFRLIGGRDHPRTLGYCEPRRGRTLWSVGARGGDVARAARDVARRIERLADRADDIVGLLRESGAELRRAVPFAFDACWFTIDPSTLLVTGHYNAHLDGEADLRRTVNLGLARNEYQEPDVNKFADLATRHRPADTLHRATNGDPHRSPRYRTLLRPLGAETEVRVAMRDRGNCWAGVALYRPPGEPDFSEREIDLILSVADRIARGVRQALLLGDLDAADPDTSPGLVLFDEQGEVEATTPAADRWLLHLVDPEPGEQDGVPHVVYAVAARCRTSDHDPTMPVRTRVPTRSGGWLVLHASLLGHGESARTAVIIEPALPMEVAPLKLQAYGLTTRELEVASRVLQGETTDQIAAALFITPYTVQDHCKSIFAKVGVTSRRELVSVLAARSLGAGSAPPTARQ